MLPEACCLLTEDTICKSKRQSIYFVHPNELCILSGGSFLCENITNTDKELKCLEEGLYPSWDAQNMNSVRLAAKLGYVYSHEYVAYEVSSEYRTH